MLRPKVAIIGCGPVGMLASLLLEHFKIEFITLEKHSSIRTHPSAHWITARSKQILSQIPNLTQILDFQCQQDWKYFTHYRYVQEIGGFSIANSDHFSPSIQERLQLSKARFGGHKPNHIAQNMLLDTMWKILKDKNRVLFNQDIIQLRQGQEPGCGVSVVNSTGQVIALADYAILCNGAKSKLRSNLGVGLIRNHTFMKVFNIYFRSKKLAELITADNSNAMLHFFCNNKLSGVLVNHSIKEGVFVAQIPDFSPFIDLLQVYSPTQLIRMMLCEKFNSNISNSDLETIHIGRWSVEQMLSEHRKRNILLAGDIAHSIPPSGGFGMNCGFQDAHQLVHALRVIFSLKDHNWIQAESLQQSIEIILERYATDRQTINLKYLLQANQNFRAVQKFTQELGLPAKILEVLEPASNPLSTLFSIIPKSLNRTRQGMRLAFFKFAYKKQQIKSPKLQLFFDQFQLKNNPLSRLSGKIFQKLASQPGSKSCYFINDRSVTREDIEKATGIMNIPDVSIEIMPNNNQKDSHQDYGKVVRSDGRIILP